MRRSFLIFLAASLILMPFAHAVNAKASSTNRPPIEQPLISEGEFAQKLAKAFNLRASHDEAAAENALSSMNIAPRNGWISDYPITPDILVEIRDSAARSASAGSLNMSESDATRAVDRVGIAMNLPIKTAGENYSSESASSSNFSSEYSSSSSSNYNSAYTSDFSSEYESGSASPEVYENEEPSAVDEYYDDNGPPIVTYYPPPWDYAYMYDWVPGPFWWGGYGFGGYYMLGDFDRHDHNHRFSNHVTNANGTVTRVNAITRATTTAGDPRSSTLAGASRSAQGSRLGSSNARAGARSIMSRQAGRNPITAVQSMNRSAAGSPGASRSRGAVQGSFSGRTHSSAPRSFAGGFRNGQGSMAGYRGSGGMGGYHGSSGGTGGYHGGGGGGGGSHGGGGGGGGGHR